MEMHEQDEQTLRRLLGTDSIPDEVRSEYNLRQDLFGRDGNSGPLGTVAIIDLLRFVGADLPAARPPVERPDWYTLLRTQGPQRVMAMINGRWHPGLFSGFVPGGNLTIKLDHSDYVREVAPRYVILGDKPPNEEQASEKPKKRRRPIVVADMSGEEVDWANIELHTHVLVQRGTELKEGVITDFATNTDGPLVLVEDSTTPERIDPARLSVSSEVPA